MLFLTELLPIFYIWDPYKSNDVRLWLADYFPDTYPEVFGLLKADLYWSKGVDLYYIKFVDGKILFPFYILFNGSYLRFIKESGILNSIVGFYGLGFWGWTMRAA